MIWQKFEVVIPRMPGFGKPSPPNHLNSIDDISYVWLDLLDRLDLTGVTTGVLVGGWLALEMASKSTSWLPDGAGLLGRCEIRWGL